MIFGLTGKNASGKGEVAKYLHEKGFSYLSLSDEIRIELEHRQLEESRENLIVVGNEIREKEGPGALAKRLGKRISEKVIVDSIRNPKEVEVLRELPNFKLISVAAPLEVRFQRAMERGRSENAKTIEKFKAMEERENSENPNAQQLNATIGMADIIVRNDSDIDSLHKKIDELLDSDGS